MHIELDDDSTSLSALRICHKGKCTTWDAGMYDRTSRGAGAAIFNEINAYWATLPANRQQAIWDVYEKIQETFETVFDSNKLHSTLVALTKELLEQHPLDEIDYWIKIRSNLKIPASMKEAYGPNDPRDRTYLRADYAGLMILAIALRPMVPVWGEYIRRIKDESGSNYKEYLALGLLARSGIIRSEPMLRLRRYIEASVGTDTVTLSSVIGGLGSAELPEWLLGLALTRPVVLVNISECDDRNNIISNIYRVVKNSIDTLNRKFSGAINEKRRVNDAVDDDNSSLAENYKVKQEISDGDLVILSVYTEDTNAMALKVDPTVDLELVQLCQRELSRHGQLEINQHHLTLTQWSLKPAISARGIPSLNKPSLLRAMSVTQALLWHWGFIDLALLVAASPVLAQGEEMLGVVESRSRIPREHVARLMELYPYYQNIGGRQITERQQNPAVKAIELLTRTITRCDWDVIGPNRLLQLGKDSLTGKRMIAPADIKKQLADLIIFLAEKEITAKTELTNTASVASEG